MSNKKTMIEYINKLNKSKNRLLEFIDKIQTYLQFWWWSPRTQQRFKYCVIGIVIALYLKLSGMIYLALGGNNALDGNSFTILEKVYEFYKINTRLGSHYFILLCLSLMLPLCYGMILWQLHKKQTIYSLEITVGLSIALIAWLSISDTLFLLFIKEPLTLGNPIHYIRLWIFYAHDASIREKLTFAGFLGLCAILGIILIIFNKSSVPDIHGKARFATFNDIRRMKLLKREGFYLGRCYGRELFIGGYEHIIIIAPTGSGKTTENSVINLYNWQHSCIPLDVKLTLFKLTSGYRKKIGQMVFLWAPGQINSNAYNPLDFISKDLILRIDQVQRIAHILIPDNPKVPDPFWYQNARFILIAMIHYVLDTKECKKTFGEINLLIKSTPNITEFAQEITKRSDLHYICRNNFLRFLNTNHKTHKNIIDTLLTYLAIFDNPLIEAATSCSDFDIRNLRKKKMTIYVGVNPADIERLSPLISMFYEQVADEMLRKMPEADEPYDLLLQLDEFAALRRMESFIKIGIFRDYRVRAAIYIQDLSQLFAKYGHDDAKMFLNSKVRIAFTQIDLETSRYIESCLGTDTIEVKNKGKQKSFSTDHTSHSESTSFVSRPLLLAQEIRKMPRKKMLILIEGEEAIYADKIAWYRQKRYQEKNIGAIKIPSLMKLAEEFYLRAVSMTEKNCRPIEAKEKKQLEVAANANLESVDCEREETVMQRVNASTHNKDNKTQLKDEAYVAELEETL